MVTAQNLASDILPKVDHLVYATTDLERGIAEIEKLLGVRASAGGQHPGRGTRNALVSLGDAVYLEIIGPDPAQPTPGQPRYFGIDQLDAPRLVTWAAKAANLDQLHRRAREREVSLGPVASGSRKRPDGVVLSWQFTDPATSGVIPFFIDWGDSPHPALTAAGGARLVELRAEHPKADVLQKQLRELGLNLRVDRGPRAALIAVIEGPRGRVELR